MTFALRPATTALVVIDLQHGMMALALAPHSANDVIERTARLGRTLAAVNGLVAIVTFDYAAEYADRPGGIVDAPLALPPAGLPPGWAAPVEAIATLPATVRITKHQQSAFFGTELDLQLRRRGIETVIVAGLVTNFGIEATVRDAYNLNYHVIVAADACSSTADLHDFAIEKILPRLSRVRTTDEIIAALTRAG